MNDYKSRKEKRTRYFYEHIYKKKLVPCTACNGSGWYDNTRADGSSISCSSCDGKGKYREN